MRLFVSPPEVKGIQVLPQDHAEERPTMVSSKEGRDLAPGQHAKSLILRRHLVWSHGPPRSGACGKHQPPRSQDIVRVKKNIPKMTN